MNSNPTLLFARMCTLILAGVCVVGCTGEIDPSSIRVDGVRQPRTFTSNEVSIPTETPVIGVCAGDLARAYLVEALAMPEGHVIHPNNPEDLKMLSEHVVNDLVGDVPISVAYCERTDKASVFTSQGASPIDLQVGGWSPENETMQLCFADEVFLQTSQDTPLPRYASKITTWGEWVAEHATSDVYLGRLARRYMIPAN